jgi:hypothetical protein
MIGFVPWADSTRCSPTSAAKHREWTFGFVSIQQNLNPAEIKDFYPHLETVR